MLEAMLYLKTIFGIYGNFHGIYLFIPYCQNIGIRCYSFRSRNREIQNINQIISILITKQNKNTN